MATAVALPESAVKIASGEPASYVYLGDSGQPVERRFCGTCGAALYGKPTLTPGWIFLNAPSLDETSWVRPSLHAYMEAAPAWDPSDGALPRFDKLPPSDRARSEPT